MLGDALAGILRSQLGHYLDTEVGAVVRKLELLLTPILHQFWAQELNVEVSVFATKPIILHGVKLKESAFRDFDLPLR